MGNFNFSRMTTLLSMLAVCAFLLFTVNVVKAGQRYQQQVQSKHADPLQYAMDSRSSKADNNFIHQRHLH